MIGKLKGILDSVSTDSAIIDVQGVGYVIFAPSRVLGNLPAAGEALTLFIETVVREDMIRLYGFENEGERDWFRALQSVQGVGAKVAMEILSVLTLSDVANAITLQDSAMVARAKGVGPKLAKRIVSELKDRAPTSAVVIPIGTPIHSGKGGAASPAIAPEVLARADAVSALVNLGYPEAMASNAITNIMDRSEEPQEVKALIREGLKELAN